MKLNWNFLGGWGVQNKKPSVGGVWAFSGTAQAVKCNLTKLTTKKSWHSSGGQWLLEVCAWAEQCIVVACLSVAEHSGFSVEFLVGLSRFFCPSPPLLSLFHC